MLCRCFRQSIKQLLPAASKPIALLCMLSFLTPAVARSSGRGCSIDEILPPEKRICGMLTHSDQTMNQAFVLTSDSSLEFNLNAPAVVADRFTQITQKYPSGIYICVPADPNTIPSAIEPLRVDWFAYIDPGSSGISVVNQ
jgi:hypothetical protein